MKLLSSDPANNAIGIYIDVDLHITFDSTVEPSHLNTSFFQLYRSNETYTEYNELVGLDLTVAANIVTAKPMVNLQGTSYYMLLVVGGSSGIQDVSGSTLDDNITINFRTSEMVKPKEEEVSTIGSVELYIDASKDGKVPTENTDLFNTNNENLPISFITSVPSHQSIGVNSLDKFIMIYDSDVENTIDKSILNVRYTTLPVDEDPLGDRNINVSTLAVVGNKVIFEFKDINTTFPNGFTNVEFTLFVPAYSIKGTTKKGYDTLEHKIQFAGKLEPIYATPDQIKQRLASWDEEIEIPISDYELYKLIHEKSSLLKYVYEVPATTQAELIRINQATICLVLRDIVGLGTLLNGAIKSRQILTNTIIYATSTASSIMDELAKCIKENVPNIDVVTSKQSAIAKSGIKSGSALSSLSGTDTKILGTSRGR